MIGIPIWVAVLIAIALLVAGAYMKGRRNAVAAEAAPGTDTPRNNVGWTLNIQEWMIFGILGLAGLVWLLISYQDRIVPGSTENGEVSIRRLANDFESFERDVGARLDILDETNKSWVDSVEDRTRTQDTVTKIAEILRVNDTTDRLTILEGEVRNMSSSISSLLGPTTPESIPPGAGD